MCPPGCFQFFCGSEPITKPWNFRETPFRFGGGETVMVAALARPDFAQDPLLAMNYLQKHKIKTIFGLDAHPTFKTMANKLGMNYVDVSIPDFSAPSLEIFDQAYEEIVKQAKSKKKVAIHCMGGLGRTGAVLAAIKLRELAGNESFYQHDTKMNSTIALSLEERSVKQWVKCTANVRDAVCAIRAIAGNEDTIETDLQINSLCSYELLLRRRHMLLQESKVEKSGQYLALSASTVIGH